MDFSLQETEEVGWFVKNLISQCRYIEYSFRNYLEMACKSFWECLLKVLNFLLILVGLAMVGYGVYLFVEYKNNASTGGDFPTASPSMEFEQLGRPLLLTVSVADSVFDNLPKAWYEEQLLFKFVFFVFHAVNDLSSCLFFMHWDRFWIMTVCSLLLAFSLWENGRGRIVMLKKRS